MKDDPAIACIRKTRHLISEKFDHDIEKIIHHYLLLQDKHKARLITKKQKKKERMVQ
jgi:hypothetical protein